MYLFDMNDKALCCGCKVCASVCPESAINFTYDEEGFWYPNIDSKKCINCKMCKKVCPILKDELKPLIDKNQVWAAYSNNADILNKCTSGGMFIHLSDCILEKGGVVFGHRYDENLNSFCTMAETKENRDFFCGSKYLQSDMKDIYKTIRAKTEVEKLVLVTGTPCQIDAVKYFFNQEIPANLYFVEIICHGVPSPRIFQEYIKLREKKAGKTIVNFEFRRKDKGWKTPFRRISYQDGTSCGELLCMDEFNNLFQQTDCILRPSCYKCRYAAKERVADISIADFWGIENKHPEMFNSDKGTSLVLVNTKKGEELFSYVKMNMTVKNVSLKDASERNLPLTGLPVPRVNRQKFFYDYSKRGLEYCIKKYCKPNFFLRCMIFFIKNIIGQKNIARIKKVLKVEK